MSDRIHSELDQLINILVARELTPVERDRLESLVQGDPFLMDALTGLRSIPTSSRASHIQSIRKKLKAVAERKTRTLPVWWSAAAVVLVLLGTIWILRGDLDPKERSALVTPADTLVNADLAVNEKEDETRVPNGDTVDITNAPVIVGSSISSASRASEPGAVITLAEKVPPPPATEHVIEDAGPVGGIEGYADDARKRAIPEQSEEQAFTRDEVTPLPDLEVRGVVMNRGGDPLSGADVLLQGTSFRTKTDKQGEFTIVLPQAQQQNAVVISYANYQSAVTPVIDGDSLIVRLNETTYTAPSDVMKLAQNRKDAGAQPAGRSLARPVNGERSYAKYIRQNLRYPEAAKTAGIHGTVTVEFQVQADGRPADYRIIQSIGYGCDEEAIRLIREGPAWDTSSAQVNIGRWSVEF